MKKILCLKLLVIVFLNINAQDAKPQKSWGIKFTGFVKSDFWYDSRQILGAREDLFLFYGKNKSLDKAGADINAEPSFNYSAATSRLTGIITGPDAFGAKTSGVIEGDFSGVSNDDNNGFRLRHAYVKLQWKSLNLIAGQYWHPIFVPEILPTVVSLNTGAPFQPFIRSPQLTLTWQKNKFRLIGSVISQMDYKSNGPLGKSASYMRNALIPNGHIQLQYHADKHMAGLAADYKMLRPRLVTDSLIVTNETIGTWAAMAFYKYTRPMWSFKMRGILGQNMSEHLMMGYYAVNAYDTLTGMETYTPSNNLSLWGNFVYGKKIQFSLFGGYTKNFGTSLDNTGIFYGRGQDIAYVYRITPCINFFSNKTQLSTEFEYTVAAYGIPDSKGIVRNYHEIPNLRILMTVFYFFKIYQPFRILKTFKSL